jgi:hypothetical protein
MSPGEPSIRLTTWPSGPPVTTPEIELVDVLALSAPWHVLIYGNVLRSIAVPDELAFGALFDFDCDDVDAAAAFEREHGRLGSRTPASQDHAGEHYPPFIADAPPSWRVPVARPPSFHRPPQTSGPPPPLPRPGSEGWRRRRRAVLHVTFPDAVSATGDEFFDDWTNDHDDTGMHDWSMTVRALRACALHLEATTTADAERNLPRVWREQGFGVKDADDAARWFARIINDRLRAFHLCVLVPGAQDERVWWEGARLENVLALQIRNNVNATFHRCENELCGRPFPIGVDGRKRRKYHSKECGKRQGVRNARRRSKEQGR